MQYLFLKIPQRSRQELHDLSSLETYIHFNPFIFTKTFDTTGSETSLLWMCFQNIHKVVYGVSFHRQKFSDKAFAVLQEKPLLCVAVEKNRGSRLRLPTLENFPNEVYAIVICKTKTKFLSQSDFRLPSAWKTVGPLKNMKYILILFSKLFFKIEKRKTEIGD